MTDLDPDRTEVAARLAAAVGRINRRARTDSASLGYGIVSALASIVQHGPPAPRRPVADRGRHQAHDDPDPHRARTARVHRPGPGPP
ncbi:hypothetical protein [Curtobacterium sp. MCPF17_052]|uniref:hypothetical protein n=1 Tax=Curtobacterium sp. MCPF17_052 TaxID=2175655 RepID=UPI0024DF915B|nr:hypothetical protein [Curtobacterium sp. MCPF17_052]WIB14082.1 hypothetical protein DEJ36_04530 [Curtobacterium sp. MCPF17_052]